MKKIFEIFILVALFVGNVSAENFEFSNELIVGKTFFIEEKSGYDTIAKYYLDNNRLKLFYVIFYKGQLEETDTLDVTIENNGRISYTVFNRPTELELIKITKTDYVVSEYHSKKPKNTLVLRFSKPKNFAQLILKN